jgi:2-polyprenyl-3-methyl-5-hydroxy-6-metoxy-1,4-benzoquinol methylase
MNDKKHWYDGRFYDRIIAPNQDKMFDLIKNLIPESSNVLDVGCGTGRLSFQLSDHCKKIVGIDLSSKNISVASSNLNLIPKANISFVPGDIKKIKIDHSTKFDFAIITYVIHEMPEVERKNVLTYMRTIANKIIIGDYITPTPKSLWGWINVIVEYLAGKDHYNNFKSYVKNGGIDYLVKESNLRIIKEIKNQPKTSHLVVVE